MKAYVRKRGDRWLLTKEIGRDPLNGRRVRRFASFSTEREALRARDLFLGQRAVGRYVHPSDQRLAEFLEQWLGYVKPRCGARTYERNEAIVKRHLTPALGEIRIGKLSARHISTYETRALESGRLDKKGGLSPETVRKIHWVLHQALALAVVWRLIPDNQAALVSPVHGQKAAIVPLAEKQQRQLLKAAENTRLAAPIQLALGTGMRRGEILALRWRDFDEVNRCLSVAHAFKTASAQRRIRLSASTIAMLKAHRTTQNEARLLSRGTWHRRGFVFPDEVGEPWGANAFSMAFRRLCRKAGLDCRFHDLRHTHATDLLRAGVPVKVVSERLGHASIAVTLNIYAHVLPDMQEAAAAAADAILERVTPKTS